MRRKYGVSLRNANSLFCASPELYRTLSFNLLTMCTYHMPQTGKIIIYTAGVSNLYNLVHCKHPRGTLCRIFLKINV